MALVEWLNAITAGVVCSQARSHLGVAARVVKQEQVDVVDSRAQRLHNLVKERCSHVERAAFNVKLRCEPQVCTGNS